ncbi:alpha/beta-hydrolase like protein [Zymoseptoria brevis]|uniref:Alpha/beta-hydrolase like protein n=1 Tax=Zymoseptoria brevis TaxID=1047168 RepID=A0A0F4GG17_9PEZI|nr:alpha/beta-hydrolase like protein [Zymoseptoria brevis]
MSPHLSGPGYLSVTIQPGKNTDPAAFHEWYNTEHGPLRLRLPFITSGDRYHAADSLQPEWSAVYDVTDLAWLEKRIYTRLREERSKREREVMASFEGLDRRIYSLYSSRTSQREGEYKGPAPATVSVSMRVKEGEDLEEVDRWYEEEHIDLVSKVPGWLRTRRFRLVVGGLNGMPAAGEVECLAVHDFSHLDALGGPEMKAAMSTAWREKVMAKVHSRELRQWSHHLTFDALDEPPSSVITTDGAVLKFQLEGNPSDPVVVCINSILTNLHIWDAATAHLLSGVNGETYRVLRYNPRGYAPLPSRSNPATFDLLADDLEYLLSRLNLPKVHAVLGVSMGGVTAINFGIRHSSLLDKFIACDCNLSSSPANSEAWAERVSLAKTKGMAELAKVTVERWFTPANHGSEEFTKVLAMAEGADFEGFRANSLALSDYDLKGKVGEITVPGLLLVGEEDGKLPEAMGKFGIEGTRLKVVKGAGHLPMLENLEGFMEVLGGFL